MRGLGRDARVLDLARVDIASQPLCGGLRDGEEPVPGGSTLVVMTLTATNAGTRLRVVESGFSDLSWPEAERARYAGQNANGWISELDELRAYAARATGSRHTR